MHTRLNRLMQKFQLSIFQTTPISYYTYFNTSKKRTRFRNLWISNGISWFLNWFQDFRQDFRILCYGYSLAMGKWRCFCQNSYQNQSTTGYSLQKDRRDGLHRLKLNEKSQKSKKRGKKTTFEWHGCTTNDATLCSCALRVAASHVATLTDGDRRRFSGFLISRFLHRFRDFM